MKIAIIGGTGLLGSNLINDYGNKGFNVQAYSRKNSINCDKEHNNLIDFDNLENNLKKEFCRWKPDIIINTIAIVNLQKCEDDSVDAYNTNVLIAKKLSIIAKKFKSYFMHISTDHYYNDSKRKHCENEEVVLLNNYARTKYQAEKEVLKNNEKALVIRTNIIGFRKNNIDSFFEWLLKSLKNQENIKLFENFLTSPISVNELGDILLKCYEKKLAGVYNISSCEVIDKYNFGIKTAEVFNFNMDNISNTEMQNDNTSKLTRALSLGLDVHKIESALGVKMPTIKQTLDCLYKKYDKELN